MKNALGHGSERRVDDPSYSTFHYRLRTEMDDEQCWACRETTGPFINSCVNPTHWTVDQRGGLILVGDGASDYRRMCDPCSRTYDRRIRNEALAEYFGVPLP